MELKNEVLGALRFNNEYKDWEEVKEEFHPTPIGYLNKEPIYPFYDAVSENLEISPRSISIATQPVESFIPFHVHNYVEMIIPLVGSCVFESRAGEVTVEENDIIMVGKGMPHKVHPISKDSVVVNIVLKSTALSFNDLDSMLQSNQGQSVSRLLFSLLETDDHGEEQYSLFEIHNNPKIVNLIYNIIEEYGVNDFQASEILRYQILTLFSLLIRQAYHSNLNMTVTKNQDLNLISLLIYIEQHYADITLEEMAHHFGFNANYLSSYLKKQTGMTFIKLVHVQRINVAVQYLRYTTLPIDQISLKVGYENPSYFYKIFRKIIGSSPTNFRKESR